MEESKFLFNQFLTDKRTYNLNVSYWRVKLQKALKEKIVNEDQLFKNKNNWGKNFYDGNPIFSYQSKGKAIRIIQEDPKELYFPSDIKLIDAWIDNIIIYDVGATREIQEIVISLFLTKSSVEKCMALVKDWFFGDLNASNLKIRLSNMG